MKRQYRTFFLNAETVVLTEAEYQMFWQTRDLAKKAGMDTEFIVVDTGDRRLVLRPDTITYMLSENIDSESAVVTPPTPTQIREERKQEEANRPVTLDEQLANPEVAK